MTSHLEKFVNRYGRLPTEIDPDYLEMLRMSKYRILDLPDAKPSKCANCGGFKADGRKYIDFGLLVDWFGTVFLCGHCIKDIAIQMGFINTEEKIEFNPLPMLKENTDEAIAKLEEVLREFYEYSSNLELGASGDSVGMEHDSNGTTAPPTSTEPRSDETEQRVIEPSTVTGRTNVRSLTDLLGDTK